MRTNVWRIVLSYVLVASLWIFFSDRLLIRLGANPETLVRWSTLKGLLFVAITAWLLYFLIHRLTLRLLKTIEAWKNSERKFRTLFERIPDGIIVVDLETGRIFMGNRALAEMLAYSQEELKDLHVDQIHPEQYWPALHERFKLVEQETVPNKRTAPVRRKDGSVFYADISPGVIEIQNRNYVIAVFHDTTESLEAQENLRKAKEAAESANHAKDQFIAVLSHELRTPLTPALATVTALKESLPDHARADLEVVRRNLELETRLIDDLLDITRITRGKIALRLEQTDLHEAIRAAFDICKTAIQAKCLQCTVQLQATHSFVLGDPPRLQQIFWNLLTNAVKFTPENGVITVRTFNTENAIRVEIADTGVGIEPAELGRIFLPFEQGSHSARFGGLGLGLSIARNIAQLHHGNLNASSDGQDKGSTFVVELPTITATELPAAATTPSPGSPLPHILLVEDHADTLQILARLLRRWGYEVGTASSVKSALELAQKERFDVLISDLALPDGTGRDIMAEVKTRYGMQGIALSGYGTEADSERSRAAGFSEHLVKPINFPALRTTLDRMGADIAEKVDKAENGS